MKQSNVGATLYQANMLPKLPNTIKKREAKFTVSFQKWLTKNPQWIGGMFELKQCNTSLPFSALSLRQEMDLLAGNGDMGVVYKIRDDSRSEKLCDIVSFRNSPAWVVIKYDTEFSIISINIFLLERKRSKRKSLTKQRARELSTLTVPLRWTNNVRKCNI